MIGTDVPTAPIRVILVDDHPVVRMGMSLALQQDARFHLVGEASTAFEARRLVAEVAPDVAVVDLNLPDASGLALTRALKQDRPTMRILTVSAYADEEHVVGVLDAGSDGFLTKHSRPDELCGGIQRVFAGERVVHQSLIGMLIAKAVHRPEPQTQEPLSEREREVLSLMAAGETSKEIAVRLGLRPKTVENHRARILDKLGVANTAAAVRLAIAEGLVG